MILNIAICDDDEKISGTIEDFINQTCQPLKIQFNSDVYFHGEDLCKRLKDGECYDIIFLDIELISTNGIEVGLFIRDNIKDEITQIVYISWNSNYSLQLFDINPLNFLIKPITYESIEKVINKFLKITNFWANSFTYSKNHCKFKVKLQDIMYFESFGKKIIIHLKNQDEEFYGKLRDIYETQLLKYDFLFINQSYIVNFDYVKTFGYEQVILSNDTFLTISQPKRKTIRKRLNQIVQRRM
ncbi:MAG: LytTR family DNA-binding domain-containing protein [Oscillospiraceae bacterium]|jgi:DNA-binding LytR/AlgR family response regulator|nr:LytTR family DNA-binding domain-containing protein [Oscillospiraceae bacterium]